MVILPLKRMFNANLYYKDDKIKIICTEDLQDDDFLKNIDNSYYIFFWFPWNIDHILKLFPWEVNQTIIEKSNNKFNIKTNLIFCAPNVQTYSHIKSLDYNCILLNHNCFLDYECFNIHEGVYKEYDYIVNSRPFTMKRIYLAEGLDNLVYVKGKEINPDMYWDGWKNMNFKALIEDVSPWGVVQTCNKSKVGLVLSGNTGEDQQGIYEGCCSVCPEFLLCGLPVVSTKSQGGREYWLDEDNSIICEPEEVKESANKMLLELGRGRLYDPKMIRRNQIIKMEYDRMNFNRKVQEIFIEHKINKNPIEIFKDKFFHKMVDYEPNMEEILS